MAITQLYSNTATISSTEYSLPGNSTTLSNIATSGVYQVFIDVDAVTSGDMYSIKVYEKCVSGGTKREIYNATIDGEQGSTLWVSPSLILMHGWDVTITKISGTDRSFTWSIRQVA